MSGSGTFRCKPALMLTQWISNIFYQTLKRPELEANHMPQLSDKFKNMRSLLWLQNSEFYYAKCFQRYYSSREEQLWDWMQMNRLSCSLA
jgi:hypothetical protein